MKLSIVILALSLLFVAYDSENMQSANDPDHSIESSVAEEKRIWEDDNRGAETLFEADTKEEIRQGILDTANMEVVGVSGGLLTAVMKQITESKDNNELQLMSLLHPEAVTGATSFYNMTLHNQSVTKVELENSRATAVKKEFGLVHENLQIVKVHMIQLDGTPADLNLIYVYSDDQSEWLLFRID